MNEKLRKELIEEAEAILYNYHNSNYHNTYPTGVAEFAEGVLGFLKGLEPVTEGSFNEFGTGY